MVHSWLLKPRSLVFIPMLLFLVIALACGDDATPTSRPTATTVPQATAPPQATSTPLSTPTPVPVATPVPAGFQAPFIKEGKHGGKVPMQFVCEEARWDPHQAATACGAGLWSPLYNQVMMYNHTNPTEVIGDLAKSWDLSDDGMSYTFVLHEAKWSDGMPVTAADVGFSLDRMVEEGQPRPRVKSIAPYYAGSEVADDTTLKVNLKFANAPAFLQYLAVDYMKVLPKHIADQHPDKTELGEFLNVPENGVGSGNMVFKSYLRGDRYVYERNADYFKAPLPFFDAHHGFFINEKSRVIAAYKTEQVLMSNIGATRLQPRDYATAEAQMDNKVNLHVMVPTTIINVIMNFTKPPFDDVRLRKVVQLASDRLAVLNTVNAGFGKLGTPFFPDSWMTPPDEVVATWPGYRYVDKNTGEPVLDYYGKEVGIDVVKDPRDIEAAQSLMEEAGFGPDNRVSVFVVSQTGTWTSVSQLLQQHLKEIYMDLDINQVPGSESFAAMASGEYEITGNPHGANIIDSDDLFNVVYTPGGARNQLNWEDPRINDFFARSSKEFDPTNRQQIIWEAGDLLRQGEGHWMGVIWGASWHFIVSKRINNFFPPQTLQQGMTHEHLWLEDSSGFN